MIKYLKRLLIATSIFFNVLVGGYSNQTFSARNYYWKRQGKPNLVAIIDFIFWWDPEHSMLSWVYWRSRKDVQYNYEIGEFYDETNRRTDGESFEELCSLGEDTTLDRYRKSFGTINGKGNTDG
tara:strand:+ start:14525 stop:14896 length:372 start_codon:yes stop_codon:yes gene_type:complete